MHDKVRHTINGDSIVIEMLTNRFTHDLVHVLRNTYPVNMLQEYNTIEFNLQQVKMIDSSSLGFLFDLHNKLHTNNKSTLVIAVGDNTDLKELLHKFQVDLLLKVK